MFWYSYWIQKFRLHPQIYTKTIAKIWWKSIKYLLRKTFPSKSTCDKYNAEKTSFKDLLLIISNFPLNGGSLKLCCTVWQSGVLKYWARHCLADGYCADNCYSFGLVSITRSNTKRKPVLLLLL